MDDDYRKLSRQFQRYISNFVHTGNPNDDSGRTSNMYTQRLEWGQEFDYWPKFDMENRGYMHLCADNCHQKMYGEYLANPVIYAKENGQMDKTKIILDHTAACDMWDRLDEYGLH